MPKQISWDTEESPERTDNALPFVLPPESVAWILGFLSVFLKGLLHKSQNPALDRLLQGPDTDVVPVFVPSETSYYCPVI
jgi:hypothetical protein